MHYQGIIHRDIKPANLLLTKERIVKISDFGVSYFNQHLAGPMEYYDDEIDRELAETAGTPAFFAPELCSSVENNHDEKHITKAIDVWALGVTLYCLIYGQCPFTASTEFELFDIIPTLPLSFPTRDQIGFDTPVVLKDLISKLLTKNPNERITLDQVKRHAWVIQDLDDPSIWWKECDPSSYKTVQVTDEEVSSAVTIMGKLRKSIYRISSSISNSFSRRGSKSSSLSDIHPSPSNSIISPISSHHEPSIHENHNDQPNDGWLPTSFTNMTLSPSSSSSSLHKPPKIERHDSSSSSMSGLLVTFNRSTDNYE